MTTEAGRRARLLLAGRTAAVEWASLLLRSAGRDVRLVDPAGEGVAVRSIWDDGAVTEFVSLSDAVTELGAAALLVDLDAREPALRGLIEAGSPCPVVVLSAFGRDEAAPRGSDLTVAAASGVLHLSGASQDPEGRPIPLHDQHTETISGAFAAMALLLAAAHGHGGQLIELTKQECFAICAANEVSKWTYAGLVPTRLGSPTFQPMSVMRASDGDMFILGTSEEHWARLSAEMGDPEWAHWDVFANRGLRAENWDVLEPLLGEWVASHTRDELMQIALDLKLPFALALAPPEVEELEEELIGSPAVADWLYRLTPGPVAAPRPRSVDLARPLDGIVVLDLSTVWATPLSTQQLAHLGARVIKIESQGRLDHSRARLGELSEVDADLPEWDRKGSFRESNQGKESLALNLATEEGREHLVRLAAHADIVVSNFTPGVAERLGLSTEALWAANPGLVIGRLSAYRPGSRLAPMTGFGYAMLLACGFGYQGEGRPWVDRSIAYPDPQAGFTLCFAMLAALEERDRSGRGALIEVDLFGPSAALHRFFSHDRLDPARGFELPSPAFSDSLPCRHEEWVAVTCETREEVAVLAKALDGPEPGSDEPPRELARRLASGSLLWEAQQLQVTLQGLGLTAQRVVDVRELVREQGLVASGLFRVPEGDHHLHAASPWLLDGTRFDSDRRSPRLGEHTLTVLEELLGLSAGEVADLEARKVAW